MKLFDIVRRKNFINLLILFLMLFTLNCSPSYSKDLNMGFHIQDGDLRDFYFSISDYYRVPIRDVYLVRDKYRFILYEELPILFFIVREARVEPDLIIRYRRMGHDWYHIMIRLGLYPDRFFERYIVVDGPPYGKAWGYYKKHGKRVLVYRDLDIIELANVKFISDYYRIKPETVVEIKKKYPGYVYVHREFNSKKGAKRQRYWNY